MSSQGTPKRRPAASPKEKDLKKSSSSSMRPPPKPGPPNANAAAPQRSSSPTAQAGASSSRPSPSGGPRAGADMMGAMQDGGSGSSKRGGTAGLVTFTEDIDPLYNLPYVTIPDAARDAFGAALATIKNSALFYFAPHKVLVGRKKKDLYLLVSTGGILMVKKASGEFARYIAFEKICEMVTNVDRENANKHGGVTGYAPFMLFSLVATEPSDLVLLANDSTELAVLFTTLIRVWSNNRAYPHVRIKAADALSLGASKIDHRVPKSSRNEKPSKPTIQLLVSKQQQRMAFAEMMKRDTAVIEFFVKEKAKEVAERKQLIETSKKLRDAKLREERAGIRLIEEEEKARKKQADREVLLLASGGGGFNSKSPSSARSEVGDDRSDVYGESGSGALTLRGAGGNLMANDSVAFPTDSLVASASGALTVNSSMALKRRPRSHTLGINEALRPFINGNTGDTDVISYMSGGLFSADTSARFDLPVKFGPSRLSYAVSYTQVESKDKRTGIPYASVARRAAKKFPNLSKSSDAALLFFDTVYVNADSNTLIESYVYFCPERLYVADSEDKIRVYVEINDISNLISVESIQGMGGYEKVSESLVMMLREGMSDVLIGFKFPGRREAFIEYLKRACASSNEPTWVHLDTCKTLAETGCDLSGYDDFEEDVPRPSKKEKGEILSPEQIAEKTFPEGEFKVTAQMKIDGPQLAKGWVLWAGYVRHYIDPYPSKKKGRNADLHHNSLMYVSSTHIYLVRNQSLVRCIDSRYLRRIDVQTLYNKRITDARVQRFILVCNIDSEEFDLCVEHDWEEDAQRCMSAILQAARKTLGSDDSLPRLEPYNEVLKGKYRFYPANPNYTPEGKDLPMSQEFIGQLGQLRNKIARYFVRNDAKRITQSLDLAKEHHENAEAFFTSLMQQYGVPPEKNVNILDYRGRLGRFFGKYAPEVIPRVPLMMEKAKGAEEEMIYRLVLKYGPEPEIPSDDGDDDDNMTMALKRIFQQYDPSRVTEAREIRVKNYGTEQELMDLLRAQYGADSENPLFRVPELLSQEQLLGRPRLRRFCLRYMPDRSDEPSINALLVSHRGTIDDLMSNLVSKYGPEPDPEVTRRSLERLKRFLAKYEPTHPSDDATLEDYYASFPGTEQELFAKLVKKYGPEPLPEGAEELTDLREVIDLSKELPYAVVPDNVGDRFPTLVERPLAIYWFGLVSHWEPPSPAILRYGYVSSAHFYIADSEASVRRCIPLKAIRAIYINTKRDVSEERQCSVLFQVSATVEHDLFLTFASDSEAKAMLWIIAEIVAKQNWDGPGLKILAVKHFDEVDSQVTASPHFTLEVAPIPHQRLNSGLPEHSLRERLAMEKLGPLTIANKLWHTTSRGIDHIRDHFGGGGGVTDVSPRSLSGNGGKNGRPSTSVGGGGQGGPPPINYLTLRKVTFGAGHPNYKAMRPMDETGWAPADDIMLDKIIQSSVDPTNFSSSAPPPLPLKSSSPASSMSPAALYEQVRAVNKYSRDGKFGNVSAGLSVIQSADDDGVNISYIAPHRRPDLAILEDDDDEDEHHSHTSPDFEVTSEDGAEDFLSDMGSKAGSTNKNAKEKFKGHSGIANFEELTFDDDGKEKEYDDNKDRYKSNNQERLTYGDEASGVSPPPRRTHFKEQQDQYPALGSALHSGHAGDVASSSGELLKISPSRAIYEQRQKQFADANDNPLHVVDGATAYAQRLITTPSAYTHPTADRTSVRESLRTTLDERDIFDLL